MRIKNKHGKIKKIRENLGENKNKLKENKRFCALFYKVKNIIEIFI